MTAGKAWPELNNIETKILSLAASSAASERSLSTFGFVYTELGNCLTTNSVKKLVWINRNMPIFYDDYPDDGNRMEDFDIDNEIRSHLEE